MQLKLCRCKDKGAMGGAGISASCGERGITRSAGRQLGAKWPTPGASRRHRVFHNPACLRRETAAKRPLSGALFVCAAACDPEIPRAVPVRAVIDQTIGSRGTFTVERVQEPILLIAKTGVRIDIDTKRRGEEMARNFGVPQTGAQTVRGSLWPLMLVAFVLTGIINVAVHLR